jgi:hypothetical protein
MMKETTVGYIRKNGKLCLVVKYEYDAVVDTYYRVFSDTFEVYDKEPPLTYRIVGDNHFVKP